MLLEWLLVALVALYVRFRWSRRRVYRLERQIYCGIRALPLLGHSYLFFGNNENLMKGFQTLGRAAINNVHGLCPLWLGHKFYTVIADAEAAAVVLKNCLEKDDIMKLTTLYFGNGSIFAPVSIWRPRRKVLVPAFATKNMKHFLSIFNKQSEVLVRCVATGRKGAAGLRAWPYYTAYTMDVIAEATLGCQLHAQTEATHPFIEAFNFGFHEVAKRLLTPWLHSDAVYSRLPVQKRMVAMKEYMWEFLAELIKKKRKTMQTTQVSIDEDKEGSSRSFVESLIRSSGDEDGYTDVEVLEELMVILMAGNDTSAVGMSFVSLMLAAHPDVQDNVYKELQEVFTDSVRAATSEDLLRLQFLDAVIKETLRLHTPVPIITRKIEHDFMLPSGIKLIAGTGVLVNLWAVHRNPRYWGADADQFRPERFLAPDAHHAAAFIAFSHGPRNCVGYQFAMTSMKTVLSTLLRRYKILPTDNPDCFPNTPLRLNYEVMMKDVDGCQIRLEPRN